MKMNFYRGLIVGCMLFSPMLVTPVVAQDADALKIMVYRVSDLVMPTRQYPYRATMPTTEPMGEIPSSQSTPSLGVGGGGGGGFFNVRSAQQSAGGGQGGGIKGTASAGGAGGFAAPQQSVNNKTGDEFHFSIRDLVQVVTSTVDPDSWDDVGGAGTCQVLGGMLIIRQSAKNHEMIEIVLSQIRSEGGARRTITLIADWLSLDDKSLKQLQGESGQATNEVDAAALATLRRTHSEYRGRLSSFSGQTVHFVSGNRKTVVESVIPVVGGNAGGYQPIVKMPNVGVLLQANTLVTPDRKQAIIDVQSIVTNWEKPEPSLKLETQTRRTSDDRAGSVGGIARAEIDRINLKTQQLATSLQLPVGKPVLVGGLSQPTSPNADHEAGDGTALYLVIEVHVSADNNKASK